ncbi:MAG TPA: 2-phospho-L-lactate guanylyltransferase, partial [Gammaproteobacteria bacterium]|nr:2-phospho-L-lactate guanylyltransferase [Gammaproteobacteria bacterium]
AHGCRPLDGPPRAAESIPMNCWAVVPIKRRSAAKQRLGGRLSPELRLALTRTMLESVVDALRNSRGVDRIAFASVERDTIPEEFPVLPDTGGGLNAVLEDARRTLIARGAGTLLVLPADLPLISAADIDAVVKSGRRGGFALGADDAGRGTNALFLRTSAAFRFQFGPDSRARHLEEAMRIGCMPAEVSSPGLSLDVDEPQDLDRLLAADDPRYLFLTAGPGGNAWHMQREMRNG